MAAGPGMWGKNELAKPKMEGWDTKEGQEKIIESSAYFHGYLPREVVEDLLHKPGDFLVFEEVADLIPITVVAVRQTAVKVVYYRLRLGLDGKVYSEVKTGFPSTGELIHHYWGRRASLTEDEAPLRFAIPVQAWQIYTSSLLIDAEYKKLGAGSFGQVARLTMKKDNGEQMPVAVKDCFSSTARDREAFFREGRITLKAQCPFTVAIFGLCTLTPPIRMVLEFLPLGDLYGYLKKRSSVDTRPSVWQLVKFCLDAAMGFAHLATLDIIHLDVATRNCLLREVKDAKGGQGNEIRAVLADFGLSKEGKMVVIEEDDAVSQRWAAPESQRTPPTATSKSDVWSFGVLMWEVFSDASIPYPDFENTQSLLMRLEEGHRMSTPKLMPAGVGKVMQATWAWESTNRPSFKNAVEHIKAALAEIPKPKHIAA